MSPKQQVLMMTKTTVFISAAGGGCLFIVLHSMGKWWCIKGSYIALFLSSPSVFISLDVFVHNDGNGGHSDLPIDGHDFEIFVYWFIIF